VCPLLVTSAMCVCVCVCVKIFKNRLSRRQTLSASFCRRRELSLDIVVLMPAYESISSTCQHECMKGPQFRGQNIAACHLHSQQSNLP
jgi:hypothetical protein